MRRLTRMCLIVAAVAVIVWVAAQFRLLAWLLQDNSLVRNVIEGLSWVWPTLAALAALVPVVRWVWGRPAPTAVGDNTPSGGHAARSSRSVGDRGVIIEDGVRGGGSGIVIGAVTGDGLTVTPAPGSASESPDPSSPARE